MAAIAFMVPASLLAQKEEKVNTGNEKKPKDVQQIIITQNGGKDEKVVVEINGDKVTVNGKPLEDYKDKDGDLNVRVQKFKDMDGLTYYPRGAQSFNGNDHFKIFTENSNSPMQGVTTEKTEGGVEVNNVTGESTAEKIGIKEGDIITKIDDTKIEDPDDLSAAIKKHKPGDKVTVAWLRDKKEQKATGELTKWKGSNIMFNGQNFNMDMGNMDLLKAIPRMNYTPRAIPRGQNGMSWSWDGNSPKLGLSVQDNEDGKGVKVTDVDDESNAAKAGIKENDIITEADGKPVNGTDDIVKVIRESKDKVSITLKVTHEGKTKDVEVKMPHKIKTADL